MTRHETREAAEARIRAALPWARNVITFRHEDSVFVEASGGPGVTYADYKGAYAYGATLDEAVDRLLSIAGGAK